MPSFRIAIDPNRKAAARFVQQVRRALQRAFIEEQEKRGISQAEIARLLGVHRSVINRELKGFKDITLGRVGELAWALGRIPEFSVAKQIHVAGANHSEIENLRLPPVAPARISSSNNGVYNTPPTLCTSAV